MCVRAPRGLRSITGNNRLDNDRVFIPVGRPQHIGMRRHRTPPQMQPVQLH